MDNDQFHDPSSYLQSSGQALEARDYGLSFVSDGWLEERVRQQGSD